MRAGNSPCLHRKQGIPNPQGYPRMMCRVHFRCRDHRLRGHTRSRIKRIHTSAYFYPPWIWYKFILLHFGVFYISFRSIFSCRFFCRQCRPAGRVKGRLYRLAGRDWSWKVSAGGTGLGWTSGAMGGTSEKKQKIPFRVFPHGHEVPEDLTRKGILFFFGAGYEARTRDIQLGKLTLYQLS